MRRAGRMRGRGRGTAGVGGLGAAITLAVTAWAGASLAADVSDLPRVLQDKVEAAAAACASFEGGEFHVAWGAVVRVDLDGDRYRDWVVNEEGFACSTAVSLFCGTGGCMSHFVVNGEVRTMLNQGWEIVDIGRHRVLLADVHGSRCGGINPTPCVTASIWDPETGAWRSAAAVWEE